MYLIHLRKAGAAKLSRRFDNADEVTEFLKKALPGTYEVLEVAELARATYPAPPPPQYTVVWETGGKCGGWPVQDTRREYSWDGAVDTATVMWRQGFRPRVYEAQDWEAWERTKRALATSSVHIPKELMTTIGWPVPPQVPALPPTPATTTNATNGAATPKSTIVLEAAQQRGEPVRLIEPVKPPEPPPERYVALIEYEDGELSIPHFGCQHIYEATAWLRDRRTPVVGSPLSPFYRGWVYREREFRQWWHDRSGQIPEPPVVAWITKDRTTAYGSGMSKALLGIPGLRSPYAVPEFYQGTPVLV
jgi:hypothetical protein